MKKIKLPFIKKNLEDFLTKEEGRISKKSVLELGVGIAALGLLVANTASAHTSYFENVPGGGQHVSGAGTPPPSVHTSYFENVPGGGKHSSHSSHASHSSHTSHASHASHSSHTSHASHASHASHSSHTSHASHASHASHSSHTSHASHASHASHSSHTSHASHASHASHSSHTSHASHASHASHSSHTSHASHVSHTSHASHASHASHSSHTSHASHVSHTSHASHASHSSHTSHASHSSHASGGGCPFIILWNGKNFVIENNILPQSEDIERKKLIVEDLYKLESTLQLEEGKYKLRILEFEQENSHFSDFKLIKITHPKEVSIGVIDNKIVAYKNLILPSSIRNKKGEDWTKKLSSLKDKAFFAGEKDDVLNVKFDKLPDGKNYYLIFRAGLRSNYPRISEISKKLEKIPPSKKRWTDSLKKIAAASAVTFAVAEAAKPGIAFGLCAPDAKMSIHIFIYIYDNNHKRKLVKIIHPRERFSLGLTDLSKYIGKKDNPVSLKIKWTNSHNLSFIGLAEVKPLDSFQVKPKTIELSKLRHSENKDINERYLKDGKVELIPGQFVELEFPAKKENINSNQKTTFILKSKGHYTSF